MAWGQIAGASSELIQLHLLVSDQLSSHTWSRSQIWAGKLSTHAWKPSGDQELAFDVSLTSASSSIMLVARAAGFSTEVAAALTREGIHFTQSVDRPDRFTLTTVPSPLAEGVSHHAKRVASRILEVRNSIEASLREEEIWRDVETGISIPHTVKQERKGNPSVVFLFTSVRSKSHWIDFGGPAGASIQSVRARVVFLLDEFSEHYSYHLALGGDTSLFDATVRFVKSYVEESGIDWDRVILAGMSKGGTSALAVATQLPQCRLVIVAPQLALGDYLSENRPAVLRSIVGSADSEGNRIADRILWDILESPESGKGITSLTLLTSDNDPHCTAELPRLANALKMGNRFRVFTDLSDNTSSHVETVRFHSSALLATLGSLCALLACEESIPEMSN